MIRNRFTKQLAYLIICSVACLCSLTGCTQHNYKKEADEKVYNIIDQKWRQDFGTKANYKISDTAPAPNDIRIEKAVPASGILTLSQAVALATAHNREYQTQKEELYIKALDLGLARYEFENQFFSGASGGYGMNEFDSDEVIAAEANFGFNRLLAGGARIGAKIAASWTEVLMSDRLLSGTVPILSITAVQPLLRGSDPRVVRENLTQAERDTLYQVRSFNRFRKTFVVAIISQYYIVLQKFDAVKNAQENYNTLDWVSERTEKLANAGRLPKLEPDRVHQERLLARDAYLQAEREYRQALDEFKIALSLPTTAEFQLDASELETLRAAEMTEPDFSETEAMETALLRRLDLVNNADAVIDAQRKVFVAADKLGMDLNVVASILEMGREGVDFFELHPLNDKVRSTVQLDLSLDRELEKNVYRKALIMLNQQQREYEQVADMVTLDVRLAHRDLAEAAERHSVQLEGLKLAEKRFKKTYLLLQYSRASSRRVLSAQDDLFDAQNAATQALIDYTIATLKFYRDTGVLHVRPDGMWEH